MAEPSRLQIFVSDPWELRTEHGVGPFYATFQGLNGNARGLCALLSEPLIIAGETCNFVWATTRSMGGLISDVFEGRKISANFVFTASKESYTSANAQYPGPRAAMGSIELA
jgi:hypothetical protein